MVSTLGTIWSIFVNILCILEGDGVLCPFFKFSNLFLNIQNYFLVLIAFCIDVVPCLSENTE